MIGISGKRVIPEIAYKPEPERHIFRVVQICARDQPLRSFLAFSGAIAARPQESAGHDALYAGLSYSR